MASSGSPATGEIRIAFLNLVTKNLTLTGPNTSHDAVKARSQAMVDAGQDGTDIVLNMATGFYTLTIVKRGQPTRTKLIHVSRVDDVEVM